MLVATMPFAMKSGQDCLSLLWKVPAISPATPKLLLAIAVMHLGGGVPNIRNQRRLGMAMFKRTFVQTIWNNVRAPGMKIWGFKTIGPESSPGLRQEHYHGISLPYFLRP